MADDLTGQVLDDRYRVIGPVGAGAMGSVYRGERLKLGRNVAIKVLNDNIPNEASRRRFEREAMAMAKLEHPNCGTVLDVGVHQGRPYVVMEFVSGQDLKELVKSGPVPIERAVEITRQVLSGLSHAHEHGIIHRDIKPANIVLSQKSGVGDHVKILDFGLARFNQDSTNLTGGMVLGTPNYMAPEQIRGGDFDQRVDLYACGVMLFELLTGSKPFHADDPMAVCMQHINTPPPKLADKAPNRSFGKLEDVVARALAKDPRERFSSADEFARALVDATKAGEAPQAPADATVPLVAKASVESPKANPRKWLVLGGVAAAAAIAAATVIVMRPDSTPREAPAAVQPAPVEKAPAAPKTIEVDPAEDVVAQAQAMTADGRREAALDVLLKARKTYPQSARIAYEASKLYLEKMWWADGLKQARAAISLDPAYKNDADLIKLVLKGFNTTASYDSTLARFLREDIGAAAKPYLEDTARAHPNAIVRKRAATELKRYR